MKNHYSTWTRWNQTKQIMNPSQWRRVYNTEIHTWINKYRKEKCLPPICGALYIPTLSALYQKSLEVDRGEYSSWMTQHWNSKLLWWSKTWSGDDELVMPRGLWVSEWVCECDKDSSKLMLMCFACFPCLCERKWKCSCTYVCFCNRKTPKKWFLSLTHTGM